MAIVNERCRKKIHLFFFILLLISTGVSTAEITDSKLSSRVRKRNSEGKEKTQISNTWRETIHVNVKKHKDRNGFSDKTKPSNLDLNDGTKPIIGSCDEFLSKLADIPHADGHCTATVNCSCKNDQILGQIVDCSNRKFHKIPERLPKKISIFLLNGNQIEKIKDGALEDLKNLKYLDISQNSITNLTKGSFQGLHGLCILKLSGNKIRYTNVTIPLSSFHYLNNLIYLDLQQNFDDTTEDEIYPSIALSALTKLQFLYLDGLNEKLFQVEFQNLSKLTNLSLIGVPQNRRCRMATIEKNKFINFPLLKSLTVVNCNILAVENGSFAELMWLQSLDLSYNMNLTFASLANITFALRGRTLHLLNLTKIHKTFGDCTRLDKKDLQYMKGMTIENFILDSNRFAGLTLLGAVSIPNITGTLSVQDNLLLVRKYVGIFLLNTNLKQLKTLNLADQMLNHNISDLFLNSYQAFNENKRDIEQYVFKPKENKRSVKRWPICEFKCENCCNRSNVLRYPVPPNLRHLNMSNMKARYPLQKICACEPNRVISIDLHKNIFYRVDGPIYGLSQLEWLDFSWNFCEYFSSNVLHELPGLKFLNLSYNYLGHVFRNDNSGDIFRMQNKLRTLDLTKNRIRFLHPKFFIGLVDLETLILVGNLLTEFEVNLKSLEKLEYLNLKHNILLRISDRLLQEFERLAVNNFTIDLYMNNLSCNCKHLNVLEWMSDSKVHLKTLKNYTCTDESGRIRNMSNAHKLYSELFEYCKSYTLLIFISSATFVFGLTVVIVCILYRYRWNLRYIYYSGRMRLNGFIPIKDDDNDFDHDVFVSFANEDNSFVRNFAIPELEEKRHLRLLLHDRDFRPGEFVHDNIVRAICTSKKTLIVMSDAYLKSIWCKFEMHMARMEAIKSGRNVLAVVLLEDVPTAGLPLEIVDLIRKQTYLEYPRENVHREQFWERLYEALK